MLRSVIVVVLSLVAGTVVISLVQAVNAMVFPPPPGLDFTDPVSVQKMVDAMSIGAWIGLELSYVFGCLTCGLLIGTFAASRPMLLAAIAGLVFTLAGFANMAWIPTPMVMAVVTTLTYVPCALLGASLATRRRAGGVTTGT